jgi:hypothetical protein
VLFLSGQKASGIAHLPEMLMLGQEAQDIAMYVVKGLAKRV